MKFISFGDLRSNASEVRKQLDSEGELVLTRRGKPIAIVSATDEAHFEQSLQELRQARALRALRTLQTHAAHAGHDGIDPDEINAEIQAVRKDRKA